MISSWPDGAWFFRSSCFVVHAGGGHLQGRRGLDVADGEHLLLADDPQRFAARTLELMGNAELRLRLAANARRLVEQHYDWRAIGRRFTSLVEDAVRQSARP